MLQLTPKQLEALPHIEWLLDANSRMGGRTTLLAHYFINKAIKTKDWIRPFDHYRPYAYEYNIRSIVPCINNMFKMYYSEEYEMLWRLSTNEFRMRKRQ